MLAWFAWWLLVSLIGWLTFPLAFRLLPALAERGYALSRALGLLLWGYAFWLLASLGVVRNDPAGLLLALALLAAFSLATGWKARRRLVAWARARRSTLLWAEGVFLAAFALWALVRAAAPEIMGTEKPMELAFINAILRSPTFPPHDPWLSGYAISYYYFGYVLVAGLAKLTATPGAVAFNLGVALVFGLGAVNAFGLVYNLLAARRSSRDPAWGLLGPLFVLFMGNLEGFLEILHRRGLFWRPGPESQPVYWFWQTFLNIKDLNTPPQPPYGWLPQRFWWWWRASRVVQDFNLAGQFQEVIDEFPQFSFVLGDLHPHVLALPFALLAVGLALNLYLGGARGRTGPLRLSKPAFALAAVTLGGMAFLNTWDFPIYVGLFAAAYALRQSRAWRERLSAFFGLGLALGVAGGLLYLPFYLGFQSQAGGILPALVTPTRGVHLWVMFGTLLVPIFTLALGRAAHWTPKGRRRALRVVLALWGMLWALMLLLTVAAVPVTAWASRRIPQAALALPALLGVWGADTLSQALREGVLRHLRYLAGGGTVALLLFLAWWGVEAEARRGASRSQRKGAFPSAEGFLWLLAFWGGLLVLTPDYLYLRDQFGTRMNTVFKFYYQGWLLWALVAAVAVAEVFRQRGRRIWLARALVGATALAGLVYPALAVPSRTNHFHPPEGWTLDGSAFLQRQSPDDWALIAYLQQAPLGAVAEAVGGSYTQYARISTFSGQPAVLGWPGHEVQWRGGAKEMGSRQDDIALLYATRSWDEAQAILQRYHIRYVVVGALERNTYPVAEGKFQQFLAPVLQVGEATLYEVPEGGPAR